jgi:predicted RNase H-like HicB family nuclease
MSRQAPLTFKEARRLARGAGYTERKAGRHQLALVKPGHPTLSLSHHGNRSYQAGMSHEIRKQIEAAMELTVTVHAEGGEFWSQVAELPGCFGTGRTLRELREELAEGIGLCLWDGPAVLSAEELAVGESRITARPA